MGKQNQRRKIYIIMNIYVSINLNSKLFISFLKIGPNDGQIKKKKIL